MPRAHTHLAVVHFDDRGGADFCSWRVQGWGHDGFLKAWKVQISAKGEPIDRMLFPDDTIAHLHIYAAPEWCRASEPFEETPAENVDVIPDDLREAIYNLHYVLKPLNDEPSDVHELIATRFSGLAHAIDRVTRYVFPGGTF